MIYWTIFFRSFVSGSEVCDASPTRSLQQPADNFVHKRSALVVVNSLPAVHIERYHAFTHGNDLASTLYFCIYTDGLCIGSIAVGERCAAFHKACAMGRDRVFLLSDLAANGVPTGRLVGIVGSEG